MKRPSAVDSSEVPKKAAKTANEEVLPKRKEARRGRNSNKKQKYTEDSSAEASHAPKEAQEVPAPVRERPVRKIRRDGPYTEYKDGKTIPEPVVPRAVVHGRNLKAISWNVAGLRALLNSRASLLERLLQEEQPDVLAILEHKLQKADQERITGQLHELLPDYEVAITACSEAKKGYSGVMALVKRREKGGPTLLNCAAWDAPCAPNEGRGVVLEFDTMYVFACYVMNSGDACKRLPERIGKFDPELQEKAKELSSKKPLVLLGDLNVAHREIDIWNAEAPHIPKQASTTPQEREKFSEFLEQGYADAFAHLHPDVRGSFTYWSIRAGNRKSNRGLRLDYAMVSMDLVQNDALPGLVDAFHIPTVFVDHCPVGAIVKY